MIKNIKNWAVAASAVLIVSAVAPSCKSDDDSVETLMERNYPPRVYVQGDRYSAPQIRYELKHSSEGVTGTTEGHFYVRLSRPVSEDVVVTLKDSVDVADVADAFSLGSKEVTIKAGQLSSDEQTVTLDASKLTSRDAIENYTITVKVDQIKSAPQGVLLSTNQNLYTAVFAKGAKSENALVAGLDDYDGVDFIDSDDRASKWKLINITEGVEGANRPNVLLGGSGDLATNNRGFSFTVDFGRTVTKLKGIYVSYFGTAYAPQNVRVEVSTDNATWTNLGELSLKDNNYTNYISFKKAYAARYVRYTVLTPATSGRTSVTSFYAYEEKSDNIFGL